ncbi:MAG: nucleotidyltransferase domain-containing protein [Thermincolia bacterium]
MAINLDNKLIESIKDIGQKYDIAKIVLFGSRARGNNKPTSDIDLAVYPLPQFSNKGYFTSDIDDLDTLLKIDIVFITSDTDLELIENIEKEGVILYERS